MVGRSVFVTGASSGLGRATAVTLSRLGARLLLNGRDEARLNETRAMLQGDGHRVYPGELSSADVTADLIKEAAQESGPLDGIFHSAGVFSVLPAKMTKQRNVEEVFNSSVPGAYGVARAAAQKKLVNDGASIVLMSSVAGARANVGLIAYAGAKAAILGLNRALAAELAPRRVRVNAIISGTIETEMHRQMLAKSADAQADANLSNHPLGYGQPEDIADAVVFLMSDASRWITGTELVVDGGYLA
jgi:NAD(P)-dependent dehydrogenase (short-subunit alcohol dehydrogenase family)